MQGLKAVALFNLNENPSEDEEQNLIEREEYKQIADELFNKYLELRNKGTSTVLVDDSVKM